MAWAACRFGGSVARVRAQPSGPFDAPPNNNYGKILKTELRRLLQREGT